MASSCQPWRQGVKAGGDSDERADGDGDLITMQELDGRAGDFLLQGLKTYDDLIAPDITYGDVGLFQPVYHSFEGCGGIMGYGGKW